MQQPAGRPVFLAQGYGGRIVISCDNGRTWSFEIPGNGSNDDHGPFSPHGVVWGYGLFVALWGWGQQANISTSNDGMTWTQAAYSGNSLSEPAFEGGIFVGGGGHVCTRSDNGTTWARAINHIGNFGGAEIVRAYGSGTLNGAPVFVGAGGGRYVYSLDGGRTWPAGTGPAACANNHSHESGDIRGAGDGRLFIVTSSGQVCRSTDGGRTWTSQTAVGQGGITDVIWANNQLWAFRGTAVSRSSDGSSWQSTGLTVPGNVSLAHVGRANDGPNAGTWAAVNANGSQFFYSSDGLTWTRASGGRAGTTMSAVIAGYVTPGGACP